MKTLHQLTASSRQDLRVYCSLGFASLTINQVRSKTQGDLLLHIEDSGSLETQRYLWTAMMLLGPTATLFQFTHRNITVNNLKNSFRPDEELGWFGTFALNSLHHTVFLPVLGDKKVAYQYDESQLEFGHQVPDDLPEVKNEVQKILCQMFIDSLFKFKENILIIVPEQLYLVEFLGEKKLTQVLASISNNIDCLDLNKIKITNKNYSWVILLLKCMPSWITTFNLSKSLDLEIRDVTKIIGLLHHAHTLNLNDNNLAQHAIPELIKLFSSFSSKLHTLHFANNNFQIITANDLKKVFSTLSSNVLYIDISDNRLENLRGDVLEGSQYSALGLFFSSFKEGIQTLVLGDWPHSATVCYDEPERERRINSFAQLPESITKLRVNNLDTTPQQFINELCMIEQNYFIEKRKADFRKRGIQLFLLISQGKPTVHAISKIINDGIEINYQDPLSGDTVLIAAVKLNNQPLVQLLLKHHADPLIMNTQGQTARTFSMPSSDLDILLQGYELLFATNKNDYERVKLIVNNNNDIINFQGAGGYTALLIAAEQSFFAIAAFLISNKADLDMSCYDGATIYDLTTDPEILKLLPVSPNHSLSNKNNPYRFFNRDLLGLSEQENELSRSSYYSIFDGRMSACNIV